MTQRHAIERVRHPVIFRRLRVERTRSLTPRMRRITLVGEDLEGFISASPDDHVKLFVPPPGLEHRPPPLPAFTDRGVVFPPGSAVSAARDYTPRRFDRERLELDIDFVLHGEGPATAWAARAAAGHWVLIGGPRGSTRVPDDFDNYVLVGDETALPAICRRLEGLPARARAIALIEVADRSEEQPLPSAAQTTVHWLHRDGERPPETADGRDSRAQMPAGVAARAAQGPAGGPDRLMQALRELRFPPGDTFVWIAAESRVIREARLHLIEERGHPEAWLKAAGYWKRGSAQGADEDPPRVRT